MENFQRNLYSRMWKLAKISSLADCPVIERIEQEMKKIPKAALDIFLRYPNQHQDTWLQYQYTQTLPTLAVRNCAQDVLIKRMNEFEAVHKEGRECLGFRKNRVEKPANFAASTEFLTKSHENLKCATEFGERLYTILTTPLNCGAFEEIAIKQARALGTGHFTVAFYGFVNDAIAPDAKFELKNLYVDTLKRSKINDGNGFRANAIIAARTLLFLKRALFEKNEKGFPYVLKSIAEFMKYALELSKSSKNQNDRAFQSQLARVYLGTKDRESANLNVISELMEERKELRGMIDRQFEKELKSRAKTGNFLLSKSSFDKVKKILMGPIAQNE